VGRTARYAHYRLVALPLVKTTAGRAVGRGPGGPPHMKPAFQIKDGPYFVLG